MIKENNSQWKNPAPCQNILQEWIWNKYIFIWKKKEKTLREFVTSIIVLKVNTKSPQAEEKNLSEWKLMNCKNMGADLSECCLKGFKNTKKQAMTHCILASAPPDSAFMSRFLLSVGKQQP